MNKIVDALVNVGLVLNTSYDPTSYERIHGVK